MLNNATRVWWNQLVEQAKKSRLLQVERADVQQRRADALQAKLERLRVALQQLVARMDAVHADPRYIGVWTLFMVHGGRYDGPYYTDELNAVKKLLAGDADGCPQLEVLKYAEPSWLKERREVGDADARPEKDSK